MTCGQQSAVGEPIILMKRYHDCATQSLVIPCGISWLSSSAESGVVNDYACCTISNINLRIFSSGKDEP